jgi:CYTH domain-containing protein
MTHKVEKEIKLLLARSPSVDFILQFEKVYFVSQIYLDKKNIKLDKYFKDADDTKIKEVRIRSKREVAGDTRYYFTLKSDGTLESDEYEMEIDEKEYKNLENYNNLGKIEKLRYIFEDIEFDSYKENLNGLFTIEIEFDVDKENAMSKLLKFLSSEYQPSEITDVTENKKYKNFNLAVNGLK